MKRLIRLGPDAPLPVAQGLEQEVLLRLYASHDGQHCRLSRQARTRIYRTMKMHGLTGKAAIVTGSAMGIGRASAIALAAAGAALAIADINEAPGAVSSARSKRVAAGQSSFARMSTR